MKAFLWYNIDKVSNNYHEDWSVLIEADSIERARELAVNMRGVEKEPDAIFTSENKAEKVWIFPNAGCRR